MKITPPVMPILPRIVESMGGDRWYVLDDKFQPIRYHAQTYWFVPAKDREDASFNLAMTESIASCISARKSDGSKLGNLENGWGHFYLFDYSAVPFLGFHSDSSYIRRIETLVEFIRASEIQVASLKDKAERHPVLGDVHGVG